MLDTSITVATVKTGTGRAVTIEAHRPVAARKFGCLQQAFCPECRSGNHAHIDAYGRPEYHCPSSRPWVGWQRVSFNEVGVARCSCEHGQVMAARGLPARCVGHALYTGWMIESGQWPAPDEMAVRYPLVIDMSGYDLFEDDLYGHAA